ncbi:MAG: Ig-like domain-containing protein, partial [Planctomycetota bacterium]
TLSASQVNENAANGTLIGTASALDPDVGETFRYTLTNDAAGRFTIDNATGDVTVADGSRLNFEAASSYVITIRVVDSGGLTRSETFTIGVRDLNETPIARGENYSTLQIDSLTISLPGGVLANDQDDDGNALAAVLVSGVSHGSLTLNADGTFTYVPDGTFAGTDSFTYVANDGSLSSTPVTVTISIQYVAPPSNPGGPQAVTVVPPVPSKEVPADNSQPVEAAPTAPPATADLTVPVEGRVLSPATEPAQLAQQATVEVLDAVVIVDPVVALEDSARQYLRSSLSHAATLTSLNTTQAIVQISKFLAPIAEAPISLFMNSANWGATSGSESTVSTETIVLGTTKVVTTALSVGYVTWLIRGTSLFASLMTSLPAWQSFDPLPILNSFEESSIDQKEEEDESLCDLVR